MLVVSAAESTKDYDGGVCEDVRVTNIIIRSSVVTET
jgi:hypothetical protein